MDRRAFIIATVPAILGTPLALKAQQPEKVYRIGFLSFRPCRESLDANGPFRQGLRELAYLEGRDLVIECRDAIGRFDRLPDLAIELVRLNTNVLVGEGTPPSLAAKRATTTIPIVMVGVGTRLGTGWWRASRVLEATSLGLPCFRRSKWW